LAPQRVYRDVIMNQNIDIERQIEFDFLRARSTAGCDNDMIKSGAIEACPANNRGAHA